MTKAEELASQAAYAWQSDKDGNLTLEMFPDAFKRGFLKGYEQAEKDIKEWVEEQLTILDKQTLLHTDDDVFWGQRNAYKQMKDKPNSL